jgi:pyrimidine-specific ribonucleoside hydrolase
MVIFIFFSAKIDFTKMKNVSLILLILFVCSGLNSVYAHKRAKYNIVIDSDGGVDDLRALTYFMASRDFNINAITTVEGVLPSEVSAGYISLFCKEFHHEGIPVGQGMNIKTSKKHYKHALPIWMNLFPDDSPTDFTNSVILLERAVRTENKRTIVIAMGPLTNIAELVKTHPDLSPKIETVLWYCDYDNQPVGFNFEQDKEAFNELMKNRIPIKMVSAKGERYEDDFLDICSQMKSIYARTIFKAFSNTSLVKEGMYYWDDFLPLYLLYPSMFDELVVMEYVRTVNPKPESYFDVLVTGILNYDKPDKGVVFNEIPTSGFMLCNDVNNFADTILNEYGYSEFKIVSLTSEIHSHLGIYSILGAKAGLRIMEYLHAGLDEIELVSYAGFNPPLSCFNDGLQVGTGSTIGYGTITVDTTGVLSPSVLVRYNGREILFSLKPDVVDQIRTEISSLVKIYGLDSEMYWIQLREITIKKYWLGMSRFDILDIKEL